MINRTGFRWLGLCLVLLLLFSDVRVSAADTIGNKTRVVLQLLLRDHIRSKTSNGNYVFWDPKSQKSANLLLKKIHPVIYKRKEKFMLCADFMDPGGKDVLIDYMVVNRNGQYVIIDEVRGRRSYFMMIFEKLN